MNASKENNFKPTSVFNDAFAQDLTKRLRMRFEVPADGAAYWRFASEPAQERSAR